MMGKEFRAVILAAGLTLIAAVSALFAKLQSGSYGSTKANSLEQTTPAQPPNDANFAVASFPSLPPELAEGVGREETQSFCGMCHGTRYITMQPPLPAATWDAEVIKMIKTFGAPIPDATAKKITSYLQSHYTPETRKR